MLPLRFIKETDGKETTDLYERDGPELAQNGRPPDEIHSEVRDRLLHEGDIHTARGKYDWNNEDFCAL